MIKLTDKARSGAFFLSNNCHIINKIFHKVIDFLLPGNYNGINGIWCEGRGRVVAVVISMGNLRESPAIKQENKAVRWLEDPFLQAELARVEMCRADHPSHVNEGIINYIFACAISYVGVSAYWLVKYII